MAKRVCSWPGCHVLIDTGTRGGRCPEHERGHDKARGTRQDRGYDAAHDLERARLQSYMDAGVTYTCWRHAARGEAAVIDSARWALGHCDDDRSRYHGPECPACNYATQDGRDGCPHPSHTPS